MPPTEEFKRPDAVKTAPGWAPGDPQAKLQYHKEKLGPILGSGIVWVRNQEWKYNFCTPTPDQEIYFPGTHSLAGQERYRWEPAPDSLGLGPGVQFGYLIPDPDKPAS